MTDWQPISTAPKDGTPILCCIVGCVPTVAWWETFPKPLPYAKRSCWRTNEAGDFEDDVAWEENWRSSFYNPTHWMPLPQPPEEMR